MTIPSLIFDMVLLPDRVKAGGDGALSDGAYDCLNLRFGGGLESNSSKFRSLSMSAFQTILTESLQEPLAINVVVLNTIYIVHIFLRLH